MRRPQGFTLILLATVVAGIAGYLVTVLVLRVVGRADYVVFAVFWSAMYLVVGGLSGIQQEITRATQRVEPSASRPASKARTFAVVVAALVLVLVVSTSPLWAHALFRYSAWGLVLPLAVGTAAYVLVAVLSGSLYGVARWESLALMIGADGLLRLALVGIGLMFTTSIVALAWFVALPFPLAIALFWFVIRRGFVGTSALDVGYRNLSWNVARTVFAAASTAVLVSGFPLLLGVTAVGQTGAFVGEFIFTITLTRAPLIITVMSLQSYLIVRFRDHAAGWLRTFLNVQAIIVVGAVVLAALGWWLGPPVFELVSGEPPTVDGQLIALLVLSSALVAALSVGASAVLARSAHFVYTAGWVAAAIVTIAVMVSPIDFVPRVVLALMLGPIAGLVVHLGWLIVSRRQIEAAAE